MLSLSSKVVHRSPYRNSQLSQKIYVKALDTTKSRNYNLRLWQHAIKISQLTKHLSAKNRLFINHSQTSPYAFVLHTGMSFSPPQQLRLLSSTTSSDIPTLNISSAGEPYWSTYVEHLKSCSTQEEVQATIEAWQHAFPGIPKPLFIYSGGPWPTLKSQYVHKGHLIEEAESFKMAMDNIEKAGMTMGSLMKNIYSISYVIHQVGVPHILHITTIHGSITLDIVSLKLVIYTQSWMT